MHGFSLDQFQRQGYTGPIRVFSEQDAARLRARFYEKIGQSEAAPGPTNAYMSAWHHQHRWAYDLAIHPDILDMVSHLLGPNLVMWAMHFWYKEPHSKKHLPWHQDAHYWPMEPKKNVSVWIALSRTFRENGCLRIIPGSHRELVEHHALNDPTSAFSHGLTAADVLESTAIDLEMEPGEAILFDEGTFHGSNANASDCARVALSIRYTSPDVKFLMDQWGDPGRIRTFLVRGEDVHHLNDAIWGKAPSA